MIHSSSSAACALVRLLPSLPSHLPLLLSWSMLLLLLLPLPQSLPFTSHHLHHASGASSSQLLVVAAAANDHHTDHHTHDDNHDDDHQPHYRRHHADRTQHDHTQRSSERAQRYTHLTLAQLIGEIDQLSELHALLKPYIKQQPHHEGHAQHKHNKQDRQQRQGDRPDDDASSSAGGHGGVLVDSYSSLLAQLHDTRLTHTFFAPSNRAIRLLTETAGQPANVTTVITPSLLAYHVLQGQHTTRSLDRLNFLSTRLVDPRFVHLAAPPLQQAQYIKVMRHPRECSSTEQRHHEQTQAHEGNDSKCFDVVLQGDIADPPLMMGVDALVIEADIHARNGVLHLIDSLIPIPVSATATLRAYNTIAQSSTPGRSSQTVTTALTLLDRTGLSAQIDLTHGLTWFVPVDAALDQLHLLPLAMARAFIMRHAVRGVYFTSDLAPTGRVYIHLQAQLNNNQSIRSCHTIHKHGSKLTLPLTTLAGDVLYIDSTLVHAGQARSQPSNITIDQHTRIASPAASEQQEQREQEPEATGDLLVRESCSPLLASDHRVRLGDDSSLVYPNDIMLWNGVMHLIDRPIETTHTRRIERESIKQLQQQQQQQHQQPHIIIEAASQPISDERHAYTSFSMPSNADIGLISPYIQPYQRPHYPLHAANHEQTPAEQEPESAHGEYTQHDASKPEQAAEEAEAAQPSSTLVTRMPTATPAVAAIVAQTDQQPTERREQLQQQASSGRPRKPSDYAALPLWSLLVLVSAAVGLLFLCFRLCSRFTDKHHDYAPLHVTQEAFDAAATQPQTHY